MKKGLKTRISEMWSGLRSQYRILASTFWPARERMDRTVINYELARTLYRNDGADTRLGAAFCRPIVDRVVEFMGIPTIASDNEEQDESLNRAIQRWKPKLQEAFRNSLRDSKTIVRIWQPSLMNPLVTMTEREDGALEIYPPERVQIQYNPRDPSMIERALIVNYVEWPDEDTQPIPDPTRGSRAQVKEHEIWEIITPNEYRYFDRTDQMWLTSWARPNVWGFVPMVEGYNEYDSTLSGGQSDLEAVYPFVKAFHEVLLQVLKAHKYHSTPKLKFQVSDIGSFLENNFPDVLDEDGKVIPGAAIRWEGREVLFMSDTDDMGFIEMESTLSDSRALLEFLIDCIAIAAEMPEEMFMRTESSAGASSDKKFLAFERKIERKRNNFQPLIVQLCKMNLVINGAIPEVGEVLWDEIQVETLREMAQALEMIVMSLEVVLQRQLVSDNTARFMLRSLRLFKRMKSPELEAADAKDNFNVEEVMAEIERKANSNGSGDPARVPIRTGQQGANE